jgi:type VI secretion system protein ImpA
VPIVKGEEGWYSLRDWRLAQDNKGKVKLADINKAIGAATREHFNALVEDITHARDELASLVAVLNEKLGSVAPGMTDVRKVLEEALPLVSGALQQKGGPIKAALDQPAEQGGEGAESTANGAATAPGMGAAKPIATREDIYQRLTELADLLEKIEPHSPVPYLIRRGVELGSLPFPMLMRALIREDYGAAIVEMNRELGIKPPPEGG